MNKHIIFKSLAGVVLPCCLASCMATHYSSVNDYPVKDGSVQEMRYSPTETAFSLWSPNADSVLLYLYTDMHASAPYVIRQMTPRKDGAWEVIVRGDLKGQGYTFRVYQSDAKYPMSETPGIFAVAVGANGHRAMVMPQDQTPIHPYQRADKDAIIVYEMHHRDFSIHPSSGIQHGGKFLALTENGTVSPEGLKTGIDHLKELGITHVQLLPSYDYGSIDETRLADHRYNWGYDPVNYNVPEGGYSTNPYDPTCRIREFKQMVDALHSAGIGVILDVVYNHTYDVAQSNFTQTAPDYFYRTREDNTLGNASGCGNETASERPMMRKFMVESVCYWAKEYGIDGFRFDLMAIHDIETMKDIRAALDKINPSILIYGEGWAAETPLTPEDVRPMKANIYQMPRIGAFSDDLRDGLRGSCFDDHDAAFLAGEKGHEQTICFGLAGAIEHPQVDMSKVNYSRVPWAAEPTQMVAYASCHDDMMLTDRLRTSVSPAKGKGCIADDELMRLDMLAQTIILTSQGIPFIWNGEEIMRDKKGVHNSYCSPDSINAIDWSLKAKNKPLFDYYRGLIAMRKAHPAFHMGKASLVRENLSFLQAEDCVVAYRLNGEAVNDEWHDIIVITNANRHPITLNLPTDETYTAVVQDGVVNMDGISQQQGKVTVASQRAMIVIR